MRVVVSSTINRKAGDLNLIRFSITQPKKRSSIIVLVISWRELQKVTMEPFFVMVRQELERPLRCLDQPKIINIVVLFLDVSLNFSKKLEADMNRNSLWKSHMLKFTMSLCLISLVRSLLMSSQVMLSPSKMTPRVKSMLRVYLKMFVWMKNKHWTSYSKGRLTEQLVLSSWTKSQVDLIAFILYILRANLGLSQQRKLFSQSLT